MTDKRIAKGLETRQRILAGVFALASYDARLRPHIEATQEKTRRLAGHFVPSGFFGLRISEWDVKAMGYEWIRQIASSKMSVQSIFELEAQA